MLAVAIRGVARVTLVLSCVCLCIALSCFGAWIGWHAETELAHFYTGAAPWYVARGRGYVEGGCVAAGTRVATSRRSLPRVLIRGSGSVHARVWPPLRRACRVTRRCRVPETSMSWCIVHSTTTEDVHKGFIGTLNLDAEQRKIAVFYII